jgi:hypothetical protein
VKAKSINKRLSQDDELVLVVAMHIYHATDEIKLNSTQYLSTELSSYLPLGPRFTHLPSSEIDDRHTGFCLFHMMTSSHITNGWECTGQVYVVLAMR